MTQQYGTVKVDFITFTSGTTGNETDITIPVSGLADIAESGINISGDISARNITATGNLSVSGETLTSGLIVQNNATISGNLGLSGEVTASSVTVTGTLNSSGAVNVSGLLTASGLSVSGDAGVNALTVTGLAAVGTLTTTGSATVNGPATLSSGLTVNGDTSTFNETVTIASGLTVTNGGIVVSNAGGLNVDGNAIFQDNLTVSGTADFDDINASGTTTLNELTVTGAMTFATGLFASGTEAAPSISFVGDQDTGFYNAAANEVRITTSGNDRLTVDDTGNVGIGTTAPDTTLDIVGGALNTANSINTNNQIRIGINDDDNYKATLSFGQPASPTANNYFLAISALTNGNPTNIALAKDGGNVGIGTTNPGAKLEVEGTGDNSAVISINETGSTNAFLLTQSTTENLIQSAAALPIVIQAKDSPTAQPIIFRRGSTESARFDSVGRLLVAVTSARNNFKFSGATIAPINQIEAGGSSAALSVTRNNNSQNAASVYLAKTRGTANGSNTIVQANDRLGSLSFNGADGVNLINAARIDCVVDGTPGVDDMPGRLVFLTAAAGTSTPTEQMRIDSDGNVGIGTDSPSQKLSVGTDSNSDLGNFSISIGSSVANVARQSIIRKNTDSTDLSLTIRSSEASSIGAPIVFESSTVIEAMRIAADGKVGIGTTSIGQKLTINEGTNSNPSDVTGAEKGTIFLSNTGGTTGENNYGCSISFSRINTTRRGAMIASKQTTTDADQQGLAFFTRSGTNTGSDAVAERMLINHSGNVGIGTTDPSELLSLEADGQLGITLTRTGGAPSVCSIKNESNNLTFSNNANGIAFETGATPSERGRFDTAGRLLVGATSAVTTATSAIIQAADTVGARLVLARNDASVNADNRIGEILFYSNATDGTYESCATIRCAADGTFTNDSKPSSLQFSTTADGDSTPTERMRISAEGNVGIGAVPGAKLDIAAVSGTNVEAEAIRFSRSDNASIRFHSIKTQASGGTAADNFLSFLIHDADTSTSQVNVLHLNGAGNVGIGTATPGNKLSVRGGDLSLVSGTNAADAGRSIRFFANGVDDTTNNFAEIKGGLTNATSPQQGYLRFDTSGSERVRIRQDGNVGINNTNPQTELHVTGSIRSSNLAGTGNRPVFSSAAGTITNSSSDATLKTNVTTLGNQSEVVKQLRPVTYNWIDTEERGEQQEIGFIAQEIQPLVPQVIGVNHDETLSVDYSKLTAVLTKALQEAMERIEQLESRLAALENS